MSKPAGSKLVVVLLVLAAVLGVIILVEDAMLGVEGNRYLWALNDKTGRVQTVIGFIVIDLVLVGLVLTKGVLGVKLAFAWGIIQTLAMLLDPLTGPQFGIEPLEFARYLFGIWAFDLLLVVRIITIPAAFRAMRMG
jgi:hypothetical protein